MTNTDLDLRPARADDWPAIWDMLAPVFAAGETYPYPTDMSESDAHAAWITAPSATYVAEAEGRLLGTYYIKPNQPALGAHVCNCGYVTHKDARGRGVAAAMCTHSQDEARGLGFRAMQYNLVVATNETAVRLWQRMGFAIVGTLPGAFAHAHLGDVDALVMYKTL